MPGLRSCVVTAGADGRRNSVASVFAPVRPRGVFLSPEPGSFRVRALLRSGAGLEAGSGCTL
eukprot:5586577-Alexandrium_andersonii.AAC.1